MEPYERQYVDLLLAMAVERFCERRDSLLDNPAGACLILQALANRKREAVNGPAEPTTIGEALEQMAKAAFGALLRQKTEEALEQTLAFGGD